MADEISRIGLFPGSFNPPHRGHLDLASKACRQAGLEACYFLINSINAAKQATLLPWRVRYKLLQLLLDRDDHFILAPENLVEPGSAAGMAQEQAFLPIIERLVRASARPTEVWLVRGSDNFHPPASAGPPYPPALWAIPHVIGLRHPRHHDHDFSGLVKTIFVVTEAVSSSQVRSLLAAGRPIAHLLNPQAEKYICEKALFRGDDGDGGTSRAAI